MEPVIVFELCRYLEIFFLTMPICLSVKRRKSREPDLRNIGGAGEQSCHYWPEISAETKQSEHGYSCSEATNLQCTTCQVLCAAYHPLDIKCLY